MGTHSRYKELLVGVLGWDWWLEWVGAACVRVCVFELKQDESVSI